MNLSKEILNEISKMQNSLNKINSNLSKLDSTLSNISTTIDDTKKEAKSFRNEFNDSSQNLLSNIKKLKAECLAAHQDIKNFKISNTIEKI